MVIDLSITVVFSRSVYLGDLVFAGLSLLYCVAVGKANCSFEI